MKKLKNITLRNKNVQNLNNGESKFQVITADNIEIFKECFEFLDSIENLGIYITNTERRIIFWNKTAESITGYTADEVVGKTCFENVLCHTDRHGRSLCILDVCPLAKAISLGKTLSVQSYIYSLTKSGKKIPVSVLLSPIKNKSNKIIGGIEIFREASKEVAELLLAQQVQKQWFNIDTDCKSYIGFANCMAEMVGGDLVRVFKTSNGNVAGLLADVSGHGISSALITGYLVSYLISIENTVNSPLQILNQLSEAYLKSNQSLHYFSAIAFTIDLKNKSIELANAGHTPAILLDVENETAQIIKINGDLIGLFGNEFSKVTIDNILKKKILIFSDGLPEARNTNNIQLGIEKIIDEAKHNINLSPQMLAKHLVDFALYYSDLPDPQDDISVLVIDGTLIDKQ